jgi:hypothetical protein
MSHYLLSVHTPTNGAAPEPMSDDDMRRGWEVIGALEREMKAANALVFSGRLTDPSTATVVRRKRGKTTMTDGPYAEAKEAIGGFYIIEATDLDDALEWASKTSEAIQQPIEVRPFSGAAGA